MRRVLLSVAACFVLLFAMSVPAIASTDDIAVSATPAGLSISVSPDTWVVNSPDPVAASTNYSTALTYFTITNGSTVVTDIEIKVTGATWTSAGSGWTHSDTATAGVNTVGLLSNIEGGEWGTLDVIVKAAAAFNMLEEDLAASTNLKFGLGMLTPTSFTDLNANSNTVRLTATEA